MTNISKQVNNTTVSLHRGDITRQEVEAIVNAANSALRGGGGVDGAIHRAGGPAIMEECKQIRAIQGGCDPGKAVITGGGNLKAQYVIHTVGPIYRDGRANEDQILKSAYSSSFELANSYDLKSMAFPSIGTGAYGYPLQEAADIAVNTILEHCRKETSLRDVRFVLFDQFSYEAFSDVLSAN